MLGIPAGVDIRFTHCANMRSDWLPDYASLCEGFAYEGEVIASYSLHRCKEYHSRGMD